MSYNHGSNYPVNAAEITPLDHCIASYGGTNSTLDLLPQRMHNTKRNPASTVSEQMEELIREVGYLRMELAMYKEVQFAMVELHIKVVEASESLNAALKVYMDKRAGLGCTTSFGPLARLS
jgi:hypothetical protein